MTLVRPLPARALFVTAALFVGVLDLKFRGTRLGHGIEAFGVALLVLFAAASVGGVRLRSWARLGPETDMDAFLKKTESMPALDMVEVQGDLGNPSDFDAFVRVSLSELSPDVHGVLEHVVVVISDSRRRAYGRYQRRRGRAWRGDQARFDHRLILYRRSLLRDFAQRPDLLRTQIQQLVRQAADLHLGRL